MYGEAVTSRVVLATAADAMTDRLANRLVSPPARASARKRANTDDETRHETQPDHRVMSDEERVRVRRAGAENARRSRVRQGLPERIEDPLAVAVLAALLRTSPRAPPEVESNSYEPIGSITKSVAEETLLRHAFRF
jgi:hypothetical protein